MTFAPRTRLGPYEIVAPLGAGGMGEVYRAKDSRLDREVAIKVLPERLAADPVALTRFEREAKAVAALSHPNILAIHDFGVQSGIAYSVTELLEGQTLRQRMGGTALPVRKALEYALQIAHGLSAAHDKGIVHRDLKPENIFVTEDGRVKILDFGLAKVGTTGKADLTASPTLAAGTEPGTVMGTQGYMSPEQVRGLTVDHRTDIFALGTILYEMLSGRRAFHRDTAADTMSAILREDPPEISGTGSTIPPSLDRIVHHCLEKNPGERFQSARDLAFNLEAVSTGTGSGAAPSPAAAHATRAVAPWRSFPIGLVIGLVAGALMGAGIAMGLARRAPAPPPTLSYLTYSGLDREPSTSSDGRLIAYSSVREGRSRIWLKQFPGGDEVALTTAADDTRPRISPDGSSILFVRGESGGFSIYRISVVGGEPRKLLEDAYDADWSPDGRQVVFLRQRREKEIPITILGIVDAGGEGTREIARVEGSRLDAPRWSPDGRTIAATRSQGENAPSTIWLSAIDGKNQSTLEPPPPAGSISAPAWSGAGEALLYSQSESIVALGVRGGSGRIVRQDISSGRAEIIMWIPAVTSVLDILRSGSLVIGASSRRQNLRSMSLAADSTEAGNRWLTRGNSSDRQPTFSPDGQWVLFSSNRSGNLDLWKISTTSGAIRRITEDPSDDWDPAFTPDGRHIIWSSSRAGHFEIWICGADGTGARQLTADGVDAENPTATPDGQWVVYNSSNPASPGIWKIHPDGTGATRIVEGTWSTPDVSPDGRFVAFRTSTEPRTVRVARIADGELLPFPIVLPGDLRNGRPRWMPDGKSLTFTGTNEKGAEGVYIQDFSPTQDTRATRRAMGGFEIDRSLESHGIAPDGTHLVYSVNDDTDSLMLAEGLPGIEPHRRSRP